MSSKFDINEIKVPENRQRHVGVEIEFISTHSMSEVKSRLVAAELAQFCNLTTDGSIDTDGNGGDCDGSCRDNCECSNVDEFHHTDKNSCDRYDRYYGQDQTWQVKEDCEECDSETLDECDCGGFETVDGIEIAICNGHITCVGHCPGHTYDPDAECYCECDCSNENGMELRVIATQLEIASVITKVCEVLSDCNSKVNKSCGLHVHLDMRHRNYKKAFNNLVQCQPILYGMVPASRKRNLYCKPTETNDFSNASRDRYRGINANSYSEHKTIEVRIHSGTVNAVKINSWIELLISIVTARTIDVSISDVKTLKKHVKLSLSLMSYIYSRLKKFKENVDLEEAA